MIRLGALRHWWSKAAIAVAATCAAFAPAIPSEREEWSADPDAQFTLDVLVHNLSLPNNVRAYQTPEGACVLFGDYLKALDFPIRTDFATGKASGWAFNEKNSYEIDRRTLTITHKGKRESFAITDIRETPDGWCVDDKALGKWFGMETKADVFNSVLVLKSDQKLPVEEAMLRRQRGDTLDLRRKAALALSNAPMVRLPYRLWRAPAFEFVVSGGVRYNQGKISASRDASFVMAGEIAALSYSANVTLGSNGIPQSIWARMYRSDPEGHLLGPLHATHFAFGDVPGLSTAFSSQGSSGRGVVVTNRPLTASGSFDRTEFRGRLLPGWDAELYRNGQLVGFDSDPGGTGEYVFKDVEILSDDNEYEVILHGPQGQIERSTDHINVGKDNAPPGKLWYWAGIRQVGEDFLNISKLLGKTSDPPIAGGIVGDGSNTGQTNSGGRFGPSPEATLEVQYGVARKMSVSAIVRSLIDQDERVTYAEGSVRRTIGPAVVDLAASINTQHDKAAKAQMLARIGEGSVAAIATIFDYGGPSPDGAPRPLKDIRVSGAIPIKIGKTSLPISASVGKSEFTDGTSALDASLRLSARIGRFSLSDAATYRKESTPDTTGQRVNTTTLVNQLIGAGTIAGVRVRGMVESEVLPQMRLRSLELEGTLSAGPDRDWIGAMHYDMTSKLGALELTHVRRFQNMAVALTGQVGTDGSVGARLRLNFALDPFHRGLKLSRDRLATAGLVRARVFEDLNENGRFDDGEPLEKNALVTTGMKVSDEGTDKNGEVTVGGLVPFAPTPVGIDQSSLDNPALTPLKPVQVIVPRPGVEAMVDIPLVGGGTIEGYVTKADGTAYEGVEFELVEGDGTVIATTRSDLDGYLVFENVHYGSFSLRVSQSSAAAIKAAPMGPVQVKIDRNKPVARLGAISIASLH